ncbi:hypothetical protein QCA50_008181 [Cerrena zonata]|uniref:Carboxylic ester hydrolase n=1 Tax=Cerrena zonata TaxID=2478898 RepID=A0AAW0G4N3_9APHY
MISSSLVHFTLLALGIGSSYAVPSPRAIPTVTLDKGVFSGVLDGNTNKFLGIPFAKPPTGDLRFRLPVPNDPYTGTHSASDFGPSCPQQPPKLPIPGNLAAEAVNFIVDTAFNAVFPSSEDCLTVNVWAPSSIPAGQKLPVVAWIFGGGFELGSTSMYDGGVIVKRSIALGEPVIYVSMNYRVTAFGFLASKEVKAAGVGNIGLQDQREAFRWIQKYINAFGGDPTKVTIWGESAGAISAALHMVTNGGNTEGLFRGAFMQSGSPIPVGDITHGQKFYDAIVAETGCSSASDTLQCLREVPFDTLMDAVNDSPGIFAYQSLALSWLPRADGTFLTAPPQQLMLQGSVANIPFVTGDCDDEGTLFALSSLNVTTESQLRTYITSQFIPDAAKSDIDKLLSLYPADITQGSPFDTGIFNALTPQYKRIAAMLGDLVFQSARRLFLQTRSSKQNTWSFLNKRLKALPALGSAHATDILNIYGGGDMADFLIHFVNYLDPNGASGSTWPKYTTSSPQLMTFVDGATPRKITTDNFRADAMAFVQELALDNPI